MRCNVYGYQGRRRRIDLLRPAHENDVNKISQESLGGIAWVNWEKDINAVPAIPKYSVQNPAIVIQAAAVVRWNFKNRRKNLRLINIEEEIQQVRR